MNGRFKRGVGGVTRRRAQVGDGGTGTYFEEFIGRYCEEFIGRFGKVFIGTFSLAF